MSIKNYRDLLSYPTFEERLKYLKLDGRVGEETFGWDRYLNQYLYSVRHEWKDIRKRVIIRDEGCDLGIKHYSIVGNIYVHHMNPITVEDVKNNNWDSLFNPDNLICCSYDTHLAIHYGDISLVQKEPIVRTPGDTKLW